MKVRSTCQTTFSQSLVFIAHLAPYFFAETGELTTDKLLSSKAFSRAWEKGD